MASRAKKIIKKIKTFQAGFEESHKKSRAKRLKNLQHEGKMLDEHLIIAKKRHTLDIKRKQIRKLQGPNVFDNLRENFGAGMGFDLQPPQRTKPRKRPRKKPGDDFFLN